MSKSRTIIVIASLLILLGLMIATYSYSQLKGSTVLYNKESIQLGVGRSSGFAVDVLLNGKYNVNVTGYAGGVGCCIDYYLVNDSSEVAWSSATTPALQSEFSVIHLNSGVIASQSTAGEFSFVPQFSTGYVVFFVNDNYPNATSASVNSDMILHYSSLNSLYWIITGLFAFAVGVSLLVLGVRRREKPKSLPKKMNQTQTDASA